MYILFLHLCTVFTVESCWYLRDKDYVSQSHAKCVWQQVSEPASLEPQAKPFCFPLKEQFGVMSVLNVILTVLQSYSYFWLLWLKDFIDIELQVCPFCIGLIRWQSMAGDCRNSVLTLLYTTLHQQRNCTSFPKAGDEVQHRKAGRGARVSNIFSNSQVDAPTTYPRVGSRAGFKVDVGYACIPEHGCCFIWTTRRSSQVPPRNRQ